jgi:hypothetical protein
MECLSVDVDSSHCFGKAEPEKKDCASSPEYGGIELQDLHCNSETEAIIDSDRSGCRSIVESVSVDMHDEVGTPENESTKKNVCVDE